MIDKFLRRIVLAAAVLGVMLLGGCMYLPHPAHGGDDQKNVQTTAPENSSPLIDGADRLDPAIEKQAPPSSPESRHGLLAPRSPWTWLAGAGMAAMMVLMVL